MKHNTIHMAHRRLALIVVTLAFVMLAPGIATAAESTQDAANANANMWNGGTAVASGDRLFFLFAPQADPLA